MNQEDKQMRLDAIIAIAESYEDGVALLGEQMQKLTPKFVSVNQTN